MWVWSRVGVQWGSQKLQPKLGVDTGSLWQMGLRMENLRSHQTCLGTPAFHQTGVWIWHDMDNLKI